MFNFLFLLKKYVLKFVGLLSIHAYYDTEPAAHTFLYTHHSSIKTAIFTTLFHDTSFLNDNPIALKVNVNDSIDSTLY
jgi:hypothetical protein